MAEHAAPSSPNAVSQLGGLARAYSGLNSRPSSARRQSTTGTSPGRLRKRPPNNGNILISRADAQWFLELPDAIRRKHFTLEEQMLLAGSCQGVIFDAEEEAEYRFGHRTNGSGSDEESTRTSNIYQAQSRDSFAIGKRGSMVENFTWIDTSSDLDLSLGDYRSQFSQSRPSISNQGNTITERRLFRRPLRERSFDQFSISSADHQRSPSPVSHTIRPQVKHRSFSDRTTRHSTKPSLPDLEPEATYYQDPQARLKLRVYLGSPQKFDEAIEFGFPPTHTTNTSISTSAPSRRGSRDAYHNTIKASVDRAGKSDLDHTRSASGSVVEVNVLDVHSEPEATHPYSQALLPSSKQSSIDSLGLPRISSRQHPESPYPQNFPGDREMTLRMTLTRPDLRADESALYGCKEKINAKSLPPETLPPLSDGSRAMMGPFGGPDGWGDPPRDDSVVKRLWKKVMTGGS